VGSVLVAYATRHGSTEGVAERIGARLREHGLEVEVRPVGEAGDVAAREAVVFGSPVYDQSWPPEGLAFVRDNAAALAARPVWLFSVGTIGDTTRLIGRLATREPHGIGRVRREIGPRGYRVFAGVIDRQRWPGPSRLLYRALGGRFGDNRDWPEIDAWAQEIAGALRGGRGPS
jgi:menaquinone-dependent protoporphyrinogen oxidase